MTAHELAKKLLEGPDAIVLSRHHAMGGDEEWPIRGKLNYGEYPEYDGQRHIRKPSVIIE